MDNEFKNKDFDTLAKHNASEHVRKVFSEDEQPLPLRRTNSAPTEFPTEALGELLAPAARRLQEASQTPTALCGQAVLASACLASQGHRDVENDGRVSPLSECFVAIADSGERKTAIDRIATRPARVYEEELQQKYETEYAFQKDDIAAYEAARQRVLKGQKNQKEQSVEDSMDQMLESLQSLGPEPTRPLSPVMLVDDPTYEGIVKLFGIGQPSLGLFSDEGAKLLGGIGMNEDNRLKTAAALSQFWDGEAITRTRASDEQMLSTKMRGKRLAMSLMIQPVVARQLLSKDILWGQGLLSRCLFCWPQSTIGNRLYKEINLNEDKVIQSYENRLLNIFRAPKLLRDGKRNELNLPALKPNPQAKRLWVSFYNDIEVSLKDGGKYSQIRGLGAKIPEHALRLAGILSVVSQLETMKILPHHMEGGIELARYYLAETLRINCDYSDNPDLSLAEVLLSWLISTEERHFHLSHIYQFGPNQIREAKKARQILRILEDHGYIVPTGPRFLDGSKRKETWKMRDCVSMMHN